MAKAPELLSFRVDTMGDDVPDWAVSMCEQLNQFAQQVNEALAKGITRADNLAASEKEITFTYAGAGAAGIPVAHGLSTNPKHVLCNLSYANGTEPVGAASPDVNSMWFRNAGDGKVLLYFQGLNAGTKYRAQLTFE